MIRDLLPYPITTGVQVTGSEGPHIARLVTLQSNTGQRGSDLCRMRWSDIEVAGGIPGINVVQQKTGLKLWVPFTVELRAAMDKWERQPGFILLKANGKPWANRQQMSMAWEWGRDHNPNL